MIGTAVGALTQLGLPADVLSQQQANVAAAYAVRARPVTWKLWNIAVRFP